MQGARAPQPGATNRPSPSGHVKRPSAPDRSQGTPSSSAVRPPGRPERRPAPKQPAPQRPPGAGGHGGRGTPGPIPNPEVKPASAEGTAGATLWETRAPPAPGARCAGQGRVGASEHLGGGGPERVPLFVCGRFPRFREEERPPTSPCGSVGGLFAFGASCADSAGRRRPSACRRPASRVFGGSGFWMGASGSIPLAFDAFAPGSLPGQGRGASSLARLCRRAPRPAVRYRREVVSHAPEDAEHVSRHRAACNRGGFPALCR